ncbi:MAG: HAD family hydrolase [Armatimonadetes bacterium CG2_30_59_28]|nr:HDIG domain-containing protein [Armatimonadota bacterium]OIO98115.1 MAG: HAD family hydrolase [Armatimonadetes bacterium CG2_30_59_28]PIU63590.1 MAG: HAD family hydrolase [Armatimonadetes bacterium CG07_land_8_20_14_0_80_59_28]PIX42498.1 MAG: HAD family hydrolase [Armatimonadetes bacterium CG_4_8_14_3_um_filter_58_9]PIY42422.1 MAG: HAD family hydrolase [Armatimonadetes bacterium CG_4_10_14_3_um_filter_59_10]PJB76980.1 MAG: HAD family hydrolase [Armatimonadetes bacterium CG_4_9_14_3_um_filte
MNKDAALALLHQYTKTDSLRKHAYGVEAAMRWYARKFGEDEEKWATVGLLHDFDYEQNPDPAHHPEDGAKILRERGYPEEIVYCILSHAEYLNLERKSLMDKTLFAVDELVGFLVACALVRPNKSILDMEVSSVKKKMKSKGFAAAVRREDIVAGAESRGIPLDEHIANVIAAMRGVAGELGLAGDGG